MMKKKLFLLFVLAGAMPLTMMAQDDDLYFVTSKKTVETKGSSVKNITEGPTYYAGSPRDVDEYNRRGKFRSSFQKIGVDSLGNDIIEFHVGSDIYPDTSYVDTTWTASKAYGNDYDGDFTYSRRMSRWDGYYGWYDPVFYCHWGMFPMGYYSWYDPWYYWHYYDFAWYSPWYDPWYYGYYGWGYPYRWYGRYGWGYPYYPGWGPGFYPSYAFRTSPGTHNHGRPSYNSPRGSFTGNSHSYSHGTFGGSRNAGYRNRSTASSGNTRPVRSSDGSYSNSNGNFGGSRSNYESHSSGSYSAPSRSSSTSSFGGSTYGGSRSGGGGGGYSGGGSSGGGGSRSGGGGGFGGRR